MSRPPGVREMRGASPSGTRATVATPGRVAPALLALACLGAVLAAPGSAQQVQQAEQAGTTEAELIAAIERLLPEAERLRAQAEARQAREAEARERVAEPRLDSASVGPFTVAARPAQLGEAVRAFQAAWSDVDPLTSGEPLPEDLTFVYERSEQPTLRAEGEAVRKVDVYTWGSANDPRERARAALFQVLTDAAIPQALQTWLRRAHLDVEIPADVYRSMVFSRSRVGRACAEGSVSACWSALGLGGEPRPFEAWFSETEIEARITREESGPFASIRRCEKQGYYEDCRSPVAVWYNWVDAIPAPRDVRASFLAFALRAGPPDALDRFVAAGWEDPPRPERPSGTEGESLQEWAEEGALAEWRERRVSHPTNLGPTVRERLRVATGTDPDVLMSRWIDEMMEPRSRTAEEPVHASTFFWILFFSALATRSTRWRLG